MNGLLINLYPNTGPVFEWCRKWHSRTGPAYDWLPKSVWYLKGIWNWISWMQFCTPRSSIEMVLKVGNKFWRILRPGITIRLNFAASSIIPIKNYLQLFDIHLAWIPIFWVKWQMLVEAKGISSNYSCFSPFVVHSRIIIRLWRIKHK